MIAEEEIAAKSSQDRKSVEPIAVNGSSPSRDYNWSQKSRARTSQRYPSSYFRYNQ